jgi:para-aminobenzoate synthetase/4-amino-4-deoxychorismate lyase
VTPQPPFVLLDDARPGGGMRLYRDAVEVVTAADAAGVPAALDRIRAAGARGLHAAGYLAYGAGRAFAALPPDPAPTDMPLSWFGLFERWETVDPAAFLPDPAGAWIGAPVPQIEQAEYEDQVRAILALIAAGDLYQANLSFPATVAVAGDPLAIYARLRDRARAGYGAVVATGDAAIVSLSPEMFFELTGDRVTCRPMKGTAPRGHTAVVDGYFATALATDAKQRAENLMIVDLMRNDLSRVAMPGSVAVPALFAVETYPTVHQLTSTVTAGLPPGRDAADVLAAAFPCGSITGAPKRRAMQAIAAIEARPRGIYTGAIGRIDAGGDAAFNVAIRTLAIHGDTATMALGAGIVADSDPAAEWAECLAKGRFVGDGAQGFALIETMMFDPDEGIALLDRHVARMQASAARLGFAFDRHTARNELQAATFRLREARRVRLLLSPSGAFAVETAALPAPFAGPARVAIVPLPVPPRDIRLCHKTSDRGFYDTARRDAGTDEVVFEHDGLLTEGSFTSVFASRADGLLVTPPLHHGLLPGVLRGELIAQGRAVEGPVRRADLAGGFFIGNAVRGLCPATLVAPAK